MTARLSRTFLILSLLFYGSQLLAGELNLTRNQLPVVLGPYLDYLEDQSAQLTIDDILNGGQQWTRSEQTIPTYGLSSSAHWFQINLTGQELANQELILSLDATTVDRVEFFFVQEGTVISQALAGDTIPINQLAIPYRIPIIPFQMAAPGNETFIYLRAASRAGVEIPLTLTTPAMLVQEQQGRFTFFGGFFAFFFISFCFCSILYYILREKQFLGYTLFFASSIPFFLVQTGMGRVWFWGDFAEANNRIGYISAAILIASFCLLGQALSLVGKYRDSIVIVLRFIAYSMIPVSLYFIVIPLDQISSGNTLTLMYLGMAVALTVFAMTAVTALQGSRSAMYLFFSWVLLVLAYSSLLLYRLNIVERSSVSALIGESLAILAAVMILLSLTEFVRIKNDEFAQAKMATKAKGDFLKNMSREFLTPVHLILANSKRLMAAQSKKLDDATTQHMNTVIKQSDHLHNLINDLLEMAELESESFEPEFELLEMSHFLTEVRNTMLPSAMEKGLSLTTDFASSNLLVQTDRLRLHHALVNIITNAIRFTDKGEIKIGYKAVYFKRRLGIEIFIRDTGRGMSEEFQKRMFEEFSKEDPGSEKDPQGTGLGMVIVKRMIERLDGEISFESTPGEGSEFFIRLPLREQHT